MIKDVVEAVPQVVKTSVNVFMRGRWLTAVLLNRLICIDAETTPTASERVYVIWQPVGCAKESVVVVIILIRTKDDNNGQDSRLFTTLSACV